MRSPQTIGDEFPRPGTLVFQTLVFAFHPHQDRFVIGAVVAACAWVLADSPRGDGSV